VPYDQNLREIVIEVRRDVKWLCERMPALEDRIDRLETTEAEARGAANVRAPWRSGIWGMAGAMFGALTTFIANHFSGMPSH
jgi:hypothetical protein